MCQFHTKILFLLWLLVLTATWPSHGYAIREDFLNGKAILGDYGGEIREKHSRRDGLFHIDTPRMIEHLQNLKINHYFYLIWHEKSDWDDLVHEFLPAAQKAGIDVWIYLVPPTEAPGKASEPFGTDYIAWFKAIGRVSGRYPNLKGIVIDDFNENLNFFSPQYVRKMRDAGLRENHNLKFMPQMYFPAITENFFTRYHSLLDGVIMSYRDDPYRNTQKLDRFLEQIDSAEFLAKRYHLPLVVMIYASRLSATPSNPSVLYIESTLKLALYRMKVGHLAGVVTYLLPKKFMAEEQDRLARSGRGYANLFVPNTPFVRKNDYAEWAQKIYIKPGRHYSLSFWHLNVYPVRFQNLPFAKQILINNQVVWSQRVDTTRPGVWKHEKIDLTPYLRGKTHATFSLRLIKHEKGTYPWNFAGFDQLQTDGFELENGNFEQNTDWANKSTTRALIGEILFYDEKRQAKTYQAVKKHMNAYALYLSMLRSASPDLSRQADLFLQAVLLNQDQAAKQHLRELKSLLDEKALSPAERKAIEQSIDQLISQLGKHRFWDFFMG
ncbi:hypothetical protein [Thermoactinomyces mirandus]|uniref:Uncharacterized protein n=1 Tax=Thermoactinomyces mirandus TaxID=2756294 RepID=A0A7W1XTU7_9BACL|nr:hypothetical protein [Thermoactinomyces mirandus]MBA4603120.1 hypothetical protein [Thermoactinomyces mirandus]